MQDQQAQLDALDSIITQLVQRADNLRKENEQLKQQLASTQTELANTQGELADSRRMLEDTGIRIDLLIEQLKRDTNLEPIAEGEAAAEPEAEQAPASSVTPGTL